MDEPLAFLNGRFVPAADLAVPVNDTGFVQGTTVAEQLRTFAGRIFRLEEHLARLADSVRPLEIEPDVSYEALGAAALRLVENNRRLLDPGDDLGVSIFVTPGTYAGYSEPAVSRPLVCVHTYPLPFRLWAEQYRTGQSLVVTPVGQVPPECWPSEIKCRSRMHYYLADRAAARREPGARALLLGRNGFITEASTANVLLYRREEGILSPPGSKILRGISLSVIDQLAPELGLNMVQRELRPADLAAADEAWLSSSPFCLLPVTRFEGRGRLGPAGLGVPTPAGALEQRRGPRHRRPSRTIRPAVRLLLPHRYPALQTADGAAEDFDGLPRRAAGAAAQSGRQVALFAATCQPGQ